MLQGSACIPFRPVVWILFKSKYLFIIHVENSTEPRLFFDQSQFIRQVVYSALCNLMHLLNYKSKFYCIDFLGQ